MDTEIDLRPTAFPTSSDEWRGLLLHESRAQAHEARLAELTGQLRWDLTLPGYEELSPEARRDFERNLSALASLQAYTINGRRKRLRLYLFRLYN
jgi:hypothetical protein